MMFLLEEQDGHVPFCRQLRTHLLCCGGKAMHEAIRDVQVARQELALSRKAHILTAHLGIVSFVRACLSGSCRLALAEDDHSKATLASCDTAAIDSLGTMHRVSTFQAICSPKLSN